MFGGLACFCVGEPGAVPGGSGSGLASLAQAQSIGVELATLLGAARAAKASEASK